MLTMHRDGYMENSMVQATAVVALAKISFILWRLVPMAWLITHSTEYYH